jgi:ubiquinone biosynthesis protein UbiJ
MKTSLLQPLSKALNAVLKLDPETAQRLHKLNGKSVSVELIPLHFKFICLFNNDRMELHKNATFEPDTHITGSPLQLLGVAINKRERKKFFAEDVQITGDIELGQAVIELFDGLQIDWEEQLAQLIGDVSTQHLSQIVNGVSTWLRDTRESFNRNVSDYLQEEMRWLPAREAINDFFIDIDTLRMDVDRLEARITQLKTKVK